MDTSRPKVAVSRTQIGLGLACLICGIVAGSGFWYLVEPAWIWDRYPDVVQIRNSGTAPLLNVRLQFSGGECALSTLPGKTKRTLLLNVIGESGLSLEFEDQAGMKHGDKLDVYLEPGYGGTVQLNVDDHNKVVCQSKASP